MDIFLNILVLNQEYPRVLFLVLYCSLSTSMILKKILNRISNILVKDPDISANDLNHDPSRHK